MPSDALRAWLVGRGEIEKRTTILLYTMYNLDIVLTVNCGLVTFRDRDASVTSSNLYGSVDVRMGFVSLKVWPLSMSIVL